MVDPDQDVTVYLETGLDEEYFTTQLEEVLTRFEGEEPLDLHVFVFTDAEECTLLAPRVPEEDQHGVVNACAQTDTSLAVEINDRSYMFLSVEDRFLRENKEAFRGLAVHELIHLYEQFTGDEQEIEEVVREKLGSFQDMFRECGLEENKCIDLVDDIVEVTVYAVKDVFANTELIRRGFEEDLQEYYYQSIAAGSTCPMPTFYGEEKSPAEVAEAIAFDISLLPAWLPFEASTNLEAVQVFQQIQTCYKTNIPRVSTRVNELRDVYRECFPGKEKEEFIQVFLTHITELTEELLTPQIPENP